jgi:hypothetical protein
MKTNHPTKILIPVEQALKEWTGGGISFDNSNQFAKLSLRNECSKSNFRFTRVLETHSSCRKAGFITQRENVLLLRGL